MCVSRHGACCFTQLSGSSIVRCPVARRPRSAAARRCDDQRGEPLCAGTRRTPRHASARRLTSAIGHSPQEEVTHFGYELKIRTASSGRRAAGKLWLSSVSFGRTTGSAGRTCVVQRSPIQHVRPRRPPVRRCRDDSPGRACRRSTPRSQPLNSHSYRCPIHRDAFPCSQLPEDMGVDHRAVIELRRFLQDIREEDCITFSENYME